MRKDIEVVILVYKKVTNDLLLPYINYRFSFNTNLNTSTHALLNTQKQ